MNYRRLGWCLLGLLVVGVGAWLWYTLRPTTVKLTVAAKSTSEDASATSIPSTGPATTLPALNADWLATVDERLTAATYSRSQVDVLIAQKMVSAEAINAAIDTKLTGLYTRAQVDALIAQLNVLIAQRPAGEPVEFASINEAKTGSLLPGQSQSLVTVPADGSYLAFIKRSNGLLPIQTSDFIPNV